MAWKMKRLKILLEFETPVDSNEVLDCFREGREQDSKPLTRFQITLECFGRVGGLLKMVDVIQNLKRKKVNVSSYQMTWYKD